MFNNVTDERLRELERAYRTSGAPVDAQAWVGALSRLGPVPFHEVYRTFFASLFPELSLTNAGYSEAEIVAAEELGGPLPEALRDYYRVAGKLPAHEKIAASLARGNDLESVIGEWIAEELTYQCVGDAPFETWAAAVRAELIPWTLAGPPARRSPESRW